MSAIAPRPTRPPLVWLTQVLLVLFCGILTLGGMTAIVMSRGDSSGGSMVPRLVGLVILVAMVSPAVFLFYGLARRRRWAWRGSVGFAVLFLVLVLVSQWFPAKGPLPKYEIAPSERFGAMLARVAIPVLLAVWAIRLHLSPKVREFLGVSDRAQQGR